MARSLPALCSRYFLPLALVMCIVFPWVPAAGQPSTAGAYHVDVLGAEYLTVADMAQKLANNPRYLPPSVDMIQYKLINRGMSEINAFEIEVSVQVDGKAIDVSSSPMGTSLDLLNPQLAGQCSDSKENEVEVAVGYSSTGISFKPGKTYVGSVAANVDSTKLNGSLPQVHVTVTGVIWADGKIEGKASTPMSPLGVTTMYRTRDLRQHDADSEAKALAIVDAHPEDTNIQHRIAEAIKGLQSLQQAYPVVSEVIFNLGIAANSPNPKEKFEMLDTLWTCEHQRRVALLRQYAAVAAK